MAEKPNIADLLDRAADAADAEARVRGACLQAAVNALEAISNMQGQSHELRAHATATLVNIAVLAVKL